MQEGFKNRMMDAAEIDAYENGPDEVSDVSAFLALYTELQFLEKAVKDGAEVGPLNPQEVEERRQKIDAKLEALLSQPE